eukprot:708922-Amorphochlora_amoeboformis.AAC.1
MAALRARPEDSWRRNFRLFFAILTLILLTRYPGRHLEEGGVKRTRGKGGSGGGTLGTVRVGVRVGRLVGFRRMRVGI